MEGFWEKKKRKGMSSCIAELVSSLCSGFRAGGPGSLCLDVIYWWLHFIAAGSLFRAGRPLDVSAALADLIWALMHLWIFFCAAEDML